ncbi:MULTISPECIES: hypothetical protein [Microcystis]|uniref:hypothetical protein n=1 Tax=Microcystis TaxID=1125 RepID=UPI001680BDDC|nr:hypothetical protein [Microcystis wesenbergii]MBD2115798.1 hypothetical protein [Microcystis wesenbergii FACHB-1339]
MPSIRDKIDYLTAIAEQRPLTRSDFSASSEILYGKSRSAPSQSKRSATFVTSPDLRQKEHTSKSTPPPRFSPGEVEVIRELYQSGGVDYEDLKNWLGVAKSTICHVIAKKGAYRRNFATDY